jgi:hypothetical protein
MECMTRVSVVIEDHLGKTLGHMAGIATLSKMPLVIVIIPMAGNAGSIHGVAEGVLAVTVVANQQSMFANQIERSITCVVKGGVMPVCRLMAIAAFLSAAPVVCVIFGMAAKARRRCIGKGVIGMAIETTRCCMAADQREAGLIVVKRHNLPASRRMAVVASLTDRLRMRAVIFVACDAGGRRRPMLAVGFVATGALQAIVFSLQGEIRVLVLK